MKSIFLLCTLLAGVVSAHAEDYEWVETSLSELQTNDVVVIADKSYKIALPNDDTDFKGVSVTFDSNTTKITSTVSNNIMWTLTKNTNGTVTFRRNNVPLSADSNAKLVVGTGTTSDFTFSNDFLSCTLNNEKYYIGWADVVDFYKAVLHDVVGLYSSEFALYKRVAVPAPKYVKWKMVDGTNVEVTNGNVVVIVDLNTGLAMSNDKADKDPDAVAVELNYDKDRILGDVDEKLQWTYTATDNGFQFTATDGNLYADSKGLKVGEGTDNAFSKTTIDGVEYLKINTGGKDYLVGVEESMFSNSWKLKELKDGKPDDNVKDTRFAIFVKVENEQTIPTLSFPYDNYEVNYNETIGDGSYVFYDVATCEEEYDIKYSSSNTDIAYPFSMTFDGLTHKNLILNKRGTIDFIARVEETEDHDKAVVACTIRINDSRTDKGTKTNPLTPSEAIKLANGETVEGVTLEEDRCYFIKGKVNKVNSGILAMFGDMGLDEMFEGMEGMEDMDDFDMSEMGDMMGGMDITSMIPGFAKSDGLTYYISDDGTKENRLKVVNGRGLVTLSSNPSAYCQGAELEKLQDLSPGDDVLVYGPLEISEDKNLFSSLGMGGDETGTGTGSIPGLGGDSGPTVKVGELNYLHDIRRVLQVPPYEGGENPHMYVNTTKSLSENEDFFFTINATDLLIPLTGDIQPAQVKSADEEIAKWVKIDETNENSDSLFTAIEKGKTKITVKVKVIVAPAEGDNKEKSYTMKRKFQLEVLPRDKELAGKNVGEYVLVKNTSELTDGTRLLIIGTRTKTDTENNTETKTKYALGANNSMMGGGKSGTKVEDDKITTNADGRECIKYEDVPEGVQEIILEQAEDDNSWYLNVGENENGEKLYLYASVKEKTEETNPEGSGNGSGFNMDEMMEMFMPSSGLKVGTKTGTASKVAGVDSLSATITISGDIATIKYPAIADEDDKNTIVLTSSFDMESMMNMFSSNEDEEGGSGSTSSFDMGSFDMFMASFNTKKPADIDGKKAFLPRIFGFVQYDEYPTNFGSSEWITIVSDFDVTPAEGVEAYVVTSVLPGEDYSMATLKAVESLKGGEPYLLHRNSVEDEYTMTRTSDVSAPSVNILEVSDRETTGEKNNTSVYVLANKSKGVGFYRWTGGKLGSGRVYLPIENDSANLVHEFCTFFQGDGVNTAILIIENKELPVGLYYDIQGRRILNPTNGIHVINGKKVLVK